MNNNAIDLNEITKEITSYFLLALNYDLMGIEFNPKIDAELVSNKIYKESVDLNEEQFVQLKSNLIEYYKNYIKNNVILENERLERNLKRIEKLPNPSNLAEVEQTLHKINLKNIESETIQVTNLINWIEENIKYDTVQLTV